MSPSRAGGRRRGYDRDRGAVALEMPLAICLLLLPIAVVVMTLPQWPERQSIASSAAKQAATAVTAAPDRASGEARATALVAQTSANFGYPMSVRFEGQWCRGCSITAEVTIDVPAVVVPFAGSTGSMSYTARSTARVDDYRSLDGGS